jgi:IS5 family transposase
VEGCAYGMKIHAAVDKDTGLIHSVVTTAANVHDLTPAAELLHGEEQVVYADAGYQGFVSPEDQKRMSLDRCGLANAEHCPIRQMGSCKI